jgi:hypothetical protein
MANEWKLNDWWVATWTDLDGTVHYQDSRGNTSPPRIKRSKLSTFTSEFRAGLVLGFSFGAVIGAAVALV